MTVRHSQSGTLLMDILQTMQITQLTGHLPDLTWAASVSIVRGIQF